MEDVGGGEEGDARDGPTPPRSPFNEEEELDVAAAEAAAVAALAEAGVNEEDEGKADPEGRAIKGEEEGVEPEGQEGQEGVGSVVKAEGEAQAADSSWESPETVDAALWPGAAAEGWHVQTLGGSGRKHGQRAYIGPSCALCALPWNMGRGRGCGVVGPVGMVGMEEGCGSCGVERSRSCIQLVGVERRVEDAMG